MGNIIYFNADFILNVLECLGYGFVIVLAARRIKDFTSPAFWLVGYSSLAFSFYLVKWAKQSGLVYVQAIDVPSHTGEYVSLILAMLLYQYLRIFLGKEFKAHILGVSLVVCAVLIAVNQSVYIFLVQLAFLGLAFVILIQELVKTRQYMHRNRLFYWAFVLLLVSGSQLSLFYQKGLYSSELTFGASMILGYLTLSYHTPDVRDFIRLSIIYMLVTLVSMAIYLGGFVAVDSLLRTSSGYNPLFTGAGLAVAISLLFTPLFGFVRRGINRLFNLQSYDPSKILRLYGTKISNILDLEKLADVSIQMIVRIMDVEKAILYMVDTELGEENSTVLKLGNPRGIGELAETGGVLALDSPIVRFFNETRSPLLQYDIDFSPPFLVAPYSERKWLSNLGMDVYIPVYGKGEWIGLFALGPKKKNRFTAEDLNLLAAIASQTGVGLENARLVDNLKNLNELVREAYTSLDTANHTLAKLEITKSNFISIASHELRTPLTVALGYVEMLLEDRSLSAPLKELVKGIHKSLLRQHEIMDSMFDIAQLDTRSLEMQPQNVVIGDIIRSEVTRLAIQAAERGLEITVDLPPVPSIRADPESLRKLFSHLLTNAIKFTPNKGRIEVTGWNLPANSRDLPEGGLEIVVSDTGVGVDNEFQEIIFTKFYQPGELLNRHSTGKTKFMGSGVGLGLALSRGIVEAHGGRIWVESPGYDEEKCPGSKFHVVLPRRAQGESNTLPVGSAVKLKL